MKYSKILKERFKKKFIKYGKNLKSLGWDNKQNQNKRFEIAVKNLKFDNKKTILDIGCGFGDLCKFLKKKNILYKNYLGLDLNQVFQKKNINKRDKFLSMDFYKDNIYSNFDYVFLIGLFNFNFGSKKKNYDYMLKMLRKAYKKTNKTLIFDFISFENSRNLKNDKFIHYYKLKEVIDMCFKISKKISIDHNYKKIPKTECSIKLYK